MSKKKPWLNFTKLAEALKDKIKNRHLIRLHVFMVNALFGHFAVELKKYSLSFSAKYVIKKQKDKIKSNIGFFFLLNHQILEIGSPCLVLCFNNWTKSANTS